MIALTAAVLGLALAGGSSASPLRRDEGGCKTLFTGALGFDVMDVQLYSSAPPKQWFTFNGAVNDANGLPVLSYVNANGVAAADAPEKFEFVSCKSFPAAFPGKGAIDKYQGYIKTSDGQCLHAKELGKTTHFEKKPCLGLGHDTATGVAKHQNFQLALESFFNYYDVQFLGSDNSPVASQFEGGRSQAYTYSLRSNGLGNNLGVLYGQNDGDQPRSKQFVAYKVTA
ncbi:hypothetical protein IE53DRAFT_380139 [Violaceomyces palustris]|uniref:Uncharacterized protein n=1 Tax=Violaceomyces palustris TaxID=1673888 RepID=A0ACD0NW12_9BASI|nr:hypothetical protein IE53DRAFT_380139 [Violaceomyces palustris]